LVDEWALKLSRLSESTISQNRNNQNRTIKQIPGHLVDSASNNHQRIVRLQYNKQLDFPDYRQDNDRWIAIQNYQNANWKDLIDLWRLYNHHMVHVIDHVDEKCLSHTWKDFEGTTVTLQSMIEYYPVHLKLHLDEIEELIGFN
jgi:hypothetical protein